jgi:RNA polymerase sigma-70 factor (ECF subfamily)
MAVNTTINNQLAGVYKEHSGKVLATLIRLLRDFDLAEEAMHEAFATAIEAWDASGIPDNPVAWLISTGRFRAIDIIRRKKRLGELEPELQRLASEIEEHNFQLAEQDIEDDQLRLIFTCCHPAIDPSVQIPLTLREVCGLTTEEIASAFLVSPSTMAQRIVRGKSKIRDANIPFVIPDLPDLPERLDAVLSVVYLVFNEGYSASSGDSVTRADLSGEAIRLARLILQLLPDPEVTGLLALMLLHESRREARTDANGDIVLLEDQERSLWDQDYIKEGIALVRQSLATKRFGFYTLQAAISAVHAEAPSADATDWHQVVSLYSVLLQLEPSPVIELNRAVAVAMRDGPHAGLQLVDAILNRGELKDYHLCHATRGELLRRAGQQQEAITAFEQALALAKQLPEQRMLRRKIEQLQNL